MSDYPERLRNMGIILKENFKGSKTHHLMECSSCGHQWSATPLAKLQAFKKYPNSNGCPVCHKNRQNEKVSIIRSDVIDRIENAGLTILTPNYDGRRGDMYFYIKVRHEDCGHEFDLGVANFLNRGLVRENSCKICGIQERSAQLTQTSIDRHIEWLKTASEWQQYKYEVERITKQSYRAFIKEINPDNFTRGPSGVDGSYHLDHIISRRYCFENDIPASLCGSKENLRMIPWLENVSKGKRIVTDIPSIFVGYIVTDSVVMDNDIDNELELEIFEEIWNKYENKYEAHKEFLLYLLKIISLQFRSKLSSDIKFVSGSNSYGMVHPKIPNVIWLDRIYNILDETIYFINKERKFEIAAKGINKVVEVLSHEYTHIRQSRKNSTPNTNQSYWLQHEEIDAHVSGWLREFEQIIGDKFDANKMIDTFKIFFDRYQDGDFDKLPLKVKQKYLKKCMLR